MLEFPKITDLVEALHQKIRVEDFSEAATMDRALLIIGQYLSHPDTEEEELLAYRHYYEMPDLTLGEARLRLKKEIRSGTLPHGADRVRFQDLLLKIIVPHLRRTNSKYIAQRQREKRGAESAI